MDRLIGRWEQATGGVEKGAGRALSAGITPTSPEPGIMFVPHKRVMLLMPGQAEGCWLAEW